MEYCKALSTEKYKRYINIFIIIIIIIIDIMKVQLRRANPGISHQLRFIFTIGWFFREVAVHMHYGEKSKVICLILDVDVER